MAAPWQMCLRATGDRMVASYLSQGWQRAFCPGRQFFQPSPRALGCWCLALGDPALRECQLFKDGGVDPLGRHIHSGDPRGPQITQALSSCTSWVTGPWAWEEKGWGRGLELVMRGPWVGRDHVWHSPAVQSFSAHKHWGCLILGGAPGSLQRERLRAC